MDEGKQEEVEIKGRRGRKEIKEKNETLRV